MTKKAMQEEWWPCRGAVRWEGCAALIARRSRKSGEEKKNLARLEGGGHGELGEKAAFPTYSTLCTA